MSGVEVPSVVLGGSTNCDANVESVGARHADY
jgi:hypothetical protein